MLLIYWKRDLHKHGAQFEEIIVLWVLHFDHTPRVKTTTDFLSFHLNQLVGANHSKWNARLGKDYKDQWITRGKKRGGGRMFGKQSYQVRIGRKCYQSLNEQMDVSDICRCINSVSPTHLQDSGLLLELLILIGVSVR